MRQELDPNSVKGALRDVVKDALEFGWTAKRGKRGYRLRSPEGTQWMHLTPATSQPEQQARILRSKIRKALESERYTEDLIERLDDPNSNVNLACPECGLEFVTMTGFQSDRHPCWTRRSEASAGEQEVVKAITPMEVVEPSEGRTEPLDMGPVESTKSSDSSKMSNKEEDMVESRKKRPYSWNVVQPGLARALYDAMKSRSQHKGEATSTYANVIAAMVQETGIDNSMPPVLDDAQQKIDEILGVLGVDANMIEDAQNMQAENEKLRSDLTTLKDLLGKY